MTRAKLHMKSGAVVIVHAENFSTRRGDDNSLTAFKTTGSRDYPLYIRLDDVSAITVERRVLFGWRQI